LYQRFERLKRFALLNDSAWIKAYPNPTRMSDESGLGETVLLWDAGKADTIEIHVDSPDGPLFVRARRAGSALTGRRVRSGMRFYLQNVSGGLPLDAANTLATETVSSSEDTLIDRTTASLKRAISVARSRCTSAGLILMYHRVTEKLSDPWDLAVRPAHFAEQLQVLRRCGRPWPLRRAGRFDV
jgi:hypothetical protein